MHSKHCTHSKLRIFSGIASIPIGHSASQRPQLVQLCPSIVTRSGANLFVIASSAPNGQRYLHQKRFTSSDVTTKVSKTLLKASTSNETGTNNTIQIHVLEKNPLQSLESSDPYNSNEIGDKTNINGIPRITDVIPDPIEIIKVITR